VDNFTRRNLLLALLVGPFSFAAPDAVAKDGDDDGGGNSGSGSRNSGSGSDDRDDDRDDDDREKDDDKDEDKDEDKDDKDDKRNDDGKSSGRNRGGRNEQDRAKDAVRKGKAVSLSRLRAHVARQKIGKILDVRLNRSFFRYVYSVKVLGPNNRLKTVRFDALTLKKL
jgi:uncharacterized membrane protein YkoI